MAFFGVTAQGDYNELLHSQPVCLEQTTFDTVEDAVFEKAFATLTLGSGSLKAAALQVDGVSHILRKDLLQILPQALGRSASKQEFETFFTWFDFDSSCVMSHHEFQQSYRALKSSCAKQGEQRTCASHHTQHTDWRKHKRVVYEPQDTLLGNLTESQKVGWHAPKPHPGKEKFHPASTTDVTQREGRSLVDYYGVYTLIGLQQ